MITCIGKIDTISRERCRAHVMERFSVEKMVDGYEGVMKKVLKT